MFTINPVHDPTTAGFVLDGKPVHGSRAVRLDGEYGLMWTSGLVAEAGPSGRGSISEQVHSVCRQLRDVVAAAGGELSDVVKLMAWLPSREDVPVYAEIRKTYFGAASPASTSVICALVEEDMLIEVEAIVAVTPSV
jgi:enamine deaminase RidA (YjgF/YER057c/UK114 family)